MPNYRTLIRLEQELEKLKHKADFFTESAQEQVKELMVQLNKEQLEEGIRSDGDDIFPPYALSTIYKKIKKHQPTDRVTLKDKGAFYAGITVTENAKGFQLTSTDKKRGKLKTKYSYYIFGLTPRNLAKVKKLARLLVMEEFRKFKYRLRG